MIISTSNHLIYFIVFSFPYFMKLFMRSENSVNHKNTISYFSITKGKIYPITKETQHLNPNTIN